MSELNLIKLPECPQFIDESLAPAAKEIGKTLGNIFYLIFSPINYPTDKFKIKQAENLEKYKKDIKNELSKIPEEKLVEPPLNIAGPALDASKFYIEKDEFRKMFSKLIASSMNIDNKNFSHSSFIEIIKQLSPFDALVLKELSHKLEHPIITYMLLENEFSSFGRTGCTVVKDLIKLDCITDEKSLNLLHMALDNLSRLNLISIGYNSKLPDIEAYENTLDFFENFIKPQIELTYLIRPEFKNRSLHPRYGVLELTNYGLNFINTCIL
ncbi:DUF4393 domain-containing protein [Clostridium botulinum]|uniref:DUF4393 domain-containing protein n=1 Tax=Clostridium botulinum TaxID=1491 RepID=UPI001788B17F|nr:DUF4393 domain-containing protein [Clostridium botulinum]MBE1304524.1 DUF4393 domain-containing protein [Clostridium botulinum]